MKGKKLSKLLIALLILTSILVVGCGKKNPQTPNEPTKGADDGGNKGNSDQGDGDTTPDGQKTLADYDKVSSFKYFNIAAGVEADEFNNGLSATLVKEHTGYDVYFDQAPADATDAQTAVTNIFMLKSDYQAVKVTKAQFYTLLEMDALMPITEYVNASTNLKDAVSEFGWETAKKDGEIYAIPQKNARAVNNTAIAFRLDWLNEYNEANPSAQIPVPSEENNYSMTLSDFKTMLEFFATKVPAGGKAFAVDTNNVFNENILPAFGIYNEFADINGKLEFVIDQPGFAEYTAYMEDLFDSGLVQYQATTNDNGAVKSLQAKTVGAGRIAHWNAATIEVSDTAATDDTISYIAALIPDENRGDGSKVRVFATEGYTYYTVIPKYATPEQAAGVMDWIDKKLEKEFFLKLALGTEGETFKVENGEYYPILPAFDEQQNLADKYMDGSREEDYELYWLCRTRKTQAQDKMFTIANYNIGQTGIQSPISVMPPNPTFDTYYLGASVEVKDALVRTMFQSDVKTDLEEIRKVYNAFEGESIKNAVNEWYSTWELKDTFNTVKPR